MANLIYESELNASIEKLIKEAEEQIFLFRTKFQLPDRIKDCLKQRRNDHTLRIVFVFGDDKTELSKFLATEDFSFLKSFPNISVSHEPRLHANYYANESNGVLTSMNLQTYGDSKFIDVGIMFKTKNILKNLTNQTLGGITSLISDTENIATESADFFLKVFTNSNHVFVKEPQYESVLFGLQKKYKTSSVVIDETGILVGNSMPDIASNTPVIEMLSSENKTTAVKPETGYCLRTGISIPYDPNRPLSKEAYRSWAQFGNANYAEKYCHGCGKKASTSVNNPLCNDCNTSLNNSARKRI